MPTKFRMQIDPIGIILPSGLNYAFRLTKDSVVKVIFNNPATIVFWNDGTKTVVKCSENDTFDAEKGLALAIAKKCYGNTGVYNDVFKKWVPHENELKQEASVQFKRDRLVEYCHDVDGCRGCRLEPARCGRGAFFNIPHGGHGYMDDEEIEDAYRRVFGK